MHNVSITSHPIVDLTKPLNDTLEIFSDGEYQDPQLVIDDWCTIQEQGYWASSLKLGTQTGTHIDAPAHFIEGAATLEALDVARLMGPYFYILADDLTDVEKCKQIVRSYAGQGILFLHATSEVVHVPEDALLSLLELDCLVWVASVGVRVEGRNPLYFHQVFCERGKYLVEDLDYEAARQVGPEGTIFALPLRLEGVSGSPCRVVVQNQREGLQSMVHPE